jgi:hypothetical protein
MSFLRFLLDHHSTFYGRDENWQSDVWGLLRSNQKEMMFVIDGLDECSGLGFGLCQEYIRNPTSDVYQPTRHQRLIYSLVRGRILHGAKIFITSRPHAAGLLRDHVDRCVELEGFDAHKIEQLMIEENLSEDLIQKVMAFLDQNPRILGLCFIPRHAKCFIDLVRYRQTYNPSNTDVTTVLPSTSADLFCSIVIMLLEDSCTDLKDKKLQDSDVLEQKNNLLLQLGKIAYDGLFHTEGNLLFREDDLVQNYGLRQEDLGSNILSSYPVMVFEGTRPKSVLHFMWPHRTLQEWTSTLQLIQV